MTSTHVTEIQTMYTNVTKSKAVNSQVSAFGGSFSEVMSRTGSGNADNGKANMTEKATSEESQNTFTKNVTKEMKVEHTKSSDNGEQVEEKQAIQKETAVDDTQKMEDVVDVTKKIVSAIAEELQVSEEAVLKAMEILGITMFDLLNPDNMSQLVLQISGETDMIQLLTNEELYQSVQNLTEIVNEEIGSLQEALGMNDDEFAKLVNELKESITVEQPIEESDVVSNDEVIQEEPVVTQEETKEKTDDVKQNTSGQNETADKNLQGLGEAKAVKPEESANSGQQQATEHHEAKGEHNGQTQMNFSQQLTGMNATLEPLFAEQNMMPQISEETKQIMNQIMDYMKMNVTAEVSEMEMQLHPESLGNVKIQLAAKDGVVTAQFKAESEVVKVALESQLLQLKESLNEKGVKVAAIEVTVESHAFERNLEQGNQGNHNHYEEPQKKPARRINLNMLNGLEDMSLDEMEDADKIAAEMMAQAGNSVDFTA